MNLCFVTNEDAKVPSGVVTVLIQLFEKWDPTSFIIVLTNRNHWGQDLLKEKSDNKKNVTLVQCPWFLPSEFSWFYEGNSLIKKAILRFVTILSLPLYIIRLVLWIRQNRIDGLLSHNGGWPAGELNRWIIIAGKIANVKKNVLVIHNTPSIPKYSIKFIRHLRDKFILWCSTNVITVSDSCRNSLIQGTGLGESIKKIYNGIEPIVTINSKVNPPWNKQEISIGFVGELHERKGVHVLLESLKHINIPCEIALIGNGDEYYIDRLKELEKESPWSIKFLGFRDDVMDLYHFLDIVVLPSIEYESFGMVLLEAMLWAKPAICSDYGGMNEVVEHNKTGFVVPMNDAKALAEKLNVLLGNKALRKQMGEAGRKRLDKYFSSSANVNQYEAIFE